MLVDWCTIGDDTNNTEDVDEAEHSEDGENDDIGEDDDEGEDDVDVGELEVGDDEYILEQDDTEFGLEFI